jgi:hypothetical protein
VCLRKRRKSCAPCFIVLTLPKWTRLPVSAAETHRTGHLPRSKARVVTTPAAGRPELKRPTRPAARLARNLIAPIVLDRASTGVVMSTEDHLSRAAECLLLAVESVGRREQRGMLELAQVWLQRSEQSRNSSLSPRGMSKLHRPTQSPTREGLRRKKRRRANVAVAGTVGARGAERPWPTKRKRPR